MEVAQLLESVKLRRVGVSIMFAGEVYGCDKDTKQQKITGE
jgi:hypothetical protein